MCETCQTHTEGKIGKALNLIRGGNVKELTFDQITALYELCSQDEYIRKLFAPIAERVAASIAAITMK